MKLRRALFSLIILLLLAALLLPGPAHTAPDREPGRQPHAPQTASAPYPPPLVPIPTHGDTLAGVRALPAPPGPASLALSASADLTTKSQAGVVPATRALSPQAASLQVTATITDPFALFEPYTLYTSSTTARAVGVGDFNADGLADVVMSAGAPENLLYLFTQTLSGTLSTPLTYTTGTAPGALAVGDLNHDGRLDLAVANAADDTLSIYLQQPGGLLSSMVVYPTADRPNALTIGDLNADSLDDIAVSHGDEEVIGVFLQDPAGGLKPMVKYAAPLAGWDDIAIGDLNDDGLDDVVKMNGSSVTNPNLSVYLQTPAGALAPATPYDLGTEVGNGVAIGDLNSDGRAEVAMSYGGNRPFSHLAVFSQTITGTLTLTATHLAYDNPESVEVADVNEDGRDDALVLHGGWNSLSVYLQTPQGALAPYQLYPLPLDGARHFGPQALAIGDVNDDGLPDAVIADDQKGLVVLYHRPPGTRLFFPLAGKPIPQTVTPIFDDFSDPASGWPNILSFFADFRYLDGEYQIINHRNFVAAFATAGHRLIDLDVTVQGRRVGTIPGGYGLSFGYEEVIPVTEYYAFVVWPDFQEWNVIRFRFGVGFETLFWGVYSGINPGEGTNQLRALRQGDTLVFWVNGQQVLGASLSTYSGSRLIGLIQFPLDVGHDARFDNYTLTRP